jgi:hypothetical protein
MMEEEKMQQVSDFVSIDEESHSNIIDKTHDLIMDQHLLLSGYSRLAFTTSSITLVYGFDHDYF